MCKKFGLTFSVQHFFTCINIEMLFKMILRMQPLPLLHIRYLKYIQGYKYVWEQLLDGKFIVLYFDFINL